MAAGHLERGAARFHDGADEAHPTDRGGIGELCRRHQHFLSDVNFPERLFREISARDQRLERGDFEQRRVLVEQHLLTDAHEAVGDHTVVRRADHRSFHDQLGLFQFHPRQFVGCLSLIDFGLAGQFLLGQLAISGQLGLTQPEGFLGRLLVQSALALIEDGQRLPLADEVPAIGLQRLDDAGDACRDLDVAVDHQIRDGSDRLAQANDGRSDRAYHRCGRAKVKRD